MLHVAEKHLDWRTAAAAIITRAGHSLLTKRYELQIVLSLTLLYCLIAPVAVGRGWGVGGEAVNY